MTMTAEIRSLADDPRVFPELARGWEEMCVWLDVGVAVRVTGRARDRRFARVLEGLKALPPAQAKRLMAHARKCRAREEASEEAFQASGRARASCAAIWRVRSLWRTKTPWRPPIAGRQAALRRSWLARRSKAGEPSASGPKKTRRRRRPSSRLRRGRRISSRGLLREVA
jgi:hypothetical protein